MRENGKHNFADLSGSIAVTHIFSMWQRKRFYLFLARTGGVPGREFSKMRANLYHSMAEIYHTMVKLRLLCEIYVIYITAILVESVRLRSTYNRASKGRSPQGFCGGDVSKPVICYTLLYDF